MSFGGGRDTYTLEYLIKVTNQGGAGGLSQVNSGLTQVNTNVNNVAMSQQKLQMIQDKVAASNNKVIQGTQGVTKAMKGLAFGVLGIVTAGAEFVGMLSMWRQTTTAVAEAQAEVDTALKESGKNSKDYKDAINELNKANRWARMTFRNLMLSMFDMVPFFILTINGIVKLRNAYKFLRESQAEQAAMAAVLKKANIGVAESAALQNSSYLSLSKTQRIAKAEQALMISSNEILAASNAGVTASNLSTNSSLITSIPLLGKTEKSMGLLGRTGSKLGGMFAGVGTKISGVFAGIATAASGLIKVIAKIAIPIGIVVLAVEAWKNNWAGLGDMMNQIGVRIGAIHPILKTTMELMAKVGNTIDALVHGDFTAAKNVWVGGSKEMGDATVEMSEKQQKALDEAAQAVQEFRDSANDLFKDIARGDKKERKDFFKLLGITTGKTQFDDAKKGAKDFFNMLEKSFKNLDEVQARFKAMEKIDILSKLGFEIDPDVMKKMRYATASALEDIIPGKDVFDDLAKVVEKNAKASQPVFNKAVAQFTADHPGLTDALRAEGYPELASYLDGLAADLKAQVNKNTALNAWTTGTILDPNAGEGVTTFTKEGKAINTPKGGGGMLQPIVDSIKKGIEGFPALMDSIDWNAAGISLREHLLTIFTIPNAVALGAWFRTNLVIPIFTGLYQAFKPQVDAFVKDPIGFIIGTAKVATDWVGAFIAGLFGKKTDKELFQDIENQLVVIFNDNPVLQTLKTFIADPVAGLMDMLNGRSLGTDTAGQFNQGEMEAFPDRGHGSTNSLDKLTTWFNETVIQPITDAINTARTVLQTIWDGNPWIQYFLKGDLVGGIKSLIETIGSAVSAGQSGTADDELLTVDEAVKGFDETVVQPVIKGVDAAYNTLTAFFSDPVKAAIGAYQAGIGSWTDMMAAIVGGGSHNAEGALVDTEKADDDWWNKNLPNPGEDKPPNIDHTPLGPHGGRMTPMALSLGGMPGQPIGDLSGSQIMSKFLKDSLNAGKSLDSLSNQTDSLGNSTQQYGGILPSIMQKYKTLTMSLEKTTNAVDQYWARIDKMKTRMNLTGNVGSAMDATGRLNIESMLGQGSIIGGTSPRQESLNDWSRMKSQFGVGGGAKNDMTQVNQNKAMFGTGFDELGKAFDAFLGKVTSGLSALKVQFTTDFNTMTQNAAGVLNMLGSQWSLVANSFGTNTTVAYNAVYGIFLTLVDNVAGLFNLMGGQWNLVLTTMIGVTETIFNTPLLARWSEIFTAIGQTFTLTIDSWTLTMTTMIENTETIFNEPLLTRWSEIFTAIGETFTAMSESWTAAMELFTEDSESAMEQLTETWGDVFNAIGETFTDMDDRWAESMESFIDEGVNAMDEVTNTWGDAFNAIGETFDDMVSAWEDSMSDMESAASSAVSNILSSMKKLNTTFTTIHEIRTIHTGGGIVAKGGLMSFAQGGSISAAGGKMLTTYGPQQFTIGDNPGGRESIWAIPHNNPGPTVAKIDKFYKPGHGGEGNITVFNGMVNLRISGNDIINDTKLNRRIKMTVGENRDRFG